MRTPGSHCFFSPVSLYFFQISGYNGLVINIYPIKANYDNFKRIKEEVYRFL
jgi:hypothetical protein